MDNKMKRVEKAIEESVFKRHNLQGCEICERYADIELMHSDGDHYICQICKDTI